MTLFVIGKPIKHSLSPLIHNYWINKYGLGLEYKKMEVERESLPSLIENVRDKKITGLNITLPYKKDIISYIDEVSYSAKDIGAINTVFLRGKKVYGENTDGIGFTRALEKKTKFNFSNKSIYIIGAGGAAYGIISELIKKKVEKIYITNRTKQKTIQLVNFFKTKNKKINLEFVEWKDLVPNSDVDLIINTTSFGMKDNECLKIDINNLKDTLIFVDIIYNPKETELLKLFKKEGFVCMNGLSMLIEQAAVSFELWFNISLNNKDIEEVKKICEASY
jgi:shikimate dehydrogenase